MKANITRLFLIGNLSLFVIVTVLLLFPVVTSWVNAARLTSHQRRLYEIYSRQTELYPDAMPDEYMSPRILPYAQLAAAKDDVRSLAQHYGLEAVHFNTTESMSHFTQIDGSRLVEMQISASFTGQPAQCVNFAYGLDNSPAFIRNLGMELFGDGMAILRVEFSLFGRDEQPEYFYH